MGTVMTLDQAIRACAGLSGPIAVMICESGTHCDESAAHALGRGFGAVLALGPGAAAMAETDGTYRVEADVMSDAARTHTLNRVIAGLADKWLLILFNGEYFYYPFAETRSVKDLTEFLWSERRSSIMSYTIDLYNDAMKTGAPPRLDDAYFDAEGWYGFERGDRLADVYGGLGWRFEEYVPLNLSRVNRPAFFLARKGLTIDADLWLSDEEMNTFSCPWHHSPTVALMSFRRARTLLDHPKFSQGVDTLTWPHSRRFTGASEQLVESGLIEAGQWM